MQSNGYWRQVFFFEIKPVIDDVELYSRELIVVSNLLIHVSNCTKLLLEKERKQDLSSSQLNSFGDSFREEQKS